MKEFFHNKTIKVWFYKNEVWSFLCDFYGPCFSPEEQSAILSETIRTEIGNRELVVLLEKDIEICPYDKDFDDEAYCFFCPYADELGPGRELSIHATKESAELDYEQRCNDI